MTELPLPVVVPRAQDFDEIARLLALAFHNALDPELLEVERGTFEPERSLLVRDGATTEIGRAHV